MVRFERRDTVKAQLAVASLEREKKKPSGTYNTPEVNAALKEMFYDKCYLCEQKGLTSRAIEHRVPHQGNLDLKFDWNNLFLVCTHCNNIKGSRYNNILDCSQVAVDSKIAFRKHGYWGVPEYLEFVPLSDDEETKSTVALLEEIYQGHTAQKSEEAKMICRKVQRAMSDFKNCVREYEESDGEDKLDALDLIKKELRPSSEFTAFKRWLIRDAIDKYPELQQYCQ